jgi:hypothetical protein
MSGRLERRQLRDLKTFETSSAAPATWTQLFMAPLREVG